MNKLIAGLTAGLVFACAPSFGDDVQKDPASHAQMMKDCMARMTAKNDGSTKHEMKAACRAEMPGGMSGGNTTKGESLVAPPDAPPK